MIAALLALAGFALVEFPGVFGPPLRMRASEWTRLAAVSLVVGLAAIELGLVLFALPTVLRTLHAAGIASVCEHVLAHYAVGGEALGWAAAALAVIVGVRAGRGSTQAYRKASSAEVEPWLGRHEDRGEFELVVLPTRELLAVSVSAGRPQVLISDGLIERLSHDELEAVLRHEASHHRYAHWRYALVAASVERALRPLPLVGRSTRALRIAVEAWADEAAAGESAHGRALVHQAITAVCKPDGPVSSRQPLEQIVRDRTRRLQPHRCTRPLALRLAVLAPVLALSTASVSLMATWAMGMHHAIALAAYCPD